MKRMKILSSATLALLLGMGGAGSNGVAVAQDSSGSSGTTRATASGGQSDDDNVQYKAKTVYDFEDDMVEGDLQRPDGELIDATQNVKHSSLIEIRKDFIPEMLKSLEDV